MAVLIKQARRLRRLTLFSGAALGVCLIAAPAPGRAQPAPAVGGDAAADKTEVVVTARKRTERLQDVPIAITALGGEQLARNGHLRIEDLNQLVPNTNIVITNGHQTSFSVRGLGANPANDGLEGSTGVFLDGVYLGRPGMAAMDLIDINQIEVLRGPQGTLFGKNTTAGAVNITTALPSFQFGGAAQATYGNYDYQQYQASVTGPLIDDILAGRITAYSTNRGGNVRNITSGQMTNNLDRDGVRAQLLFTPSSNFKLRLIGEYEQEKQSTGAVLTLNSLGATPSAVEAKLAVTGATLAIDPNGGTTAVDGPVTTAAKQAAFSAQADWKVGGFNVTSITAYRNWNYESRSDTDNTSADVINGGYNLHDYQWSEELRVQPPRIGPVDTVAGLYYFQQQVTTDSIAEYGSEAAAWLSGIPNSLLPTYSKYSAALAALVQYDNSRWDTWANPDTKSYAAFGQAIWHVDPRWNVTLGFRETYETKFESVWRPQPIDTATGLAKAGLASSKASAINVGIDSAAPSFLVSSDYHFSPGAMAYALVSQGEKAGGLNATLPGAGLTADSLKVQPETATDYEAGFKGDYFQHRLNVDLSVFYTTVRNYQATYITTVNNATAQYLTNVGRVRTQGAEAEITAKPITGLTLHASAAFDDATYASYVNAPCAAEVTGKTYCNLTGRPVAGAPKWTMGLNGGYERPLTDNLIGYVQGEYSWRSRFYGYLDDSAYSRTGDYALVNLRLGVRLASGRWDLAIWGKNVFDQHYVANYLSYGTLLPGVYVPFFGDPATYGVTLRTQF